VIPNSVSTFRNPGAQVLEYVALSGSIWLYVVSFKVASLALGVILAQFLVR